MIVLLPTAAAKRTNEPNIPAKCRYCQTHRRVLNAKLKNVSHFDAKNANNKSYSFAKTLVRGSDVITSVKINLLKLFYFMPMSYSSQPINWTTLDILSIVALYQYLKCLSSLIANYFKRVDVKSMHCIAKCLIFFLHTHLCACLILGC